jgi:hypothetical protein
VRANAIQGKLALSSISHYPLGSHERSPPDLCVPDASTLFETAAVSSNLYLACMRDDETATFTRALVEERFGRNAINPRFPLEDVNYIDGGAVLYGADREDDIDGMSFERWGGDTFCSALYELADRPGSFLIWTSAEVNVAVTRETMIAHLPRDTLQFKRRVVWNGHELNAYIHCRN